MIFCFNVLSKKIKRVFDNNKLYAVEILAILVQNSDENRKILGDLDGIDILLNQIAVKLSIITY
jgi:beta-catenin-like protein 1